MMATDDGPGLHRTSMLTDAVVAIAMTLLVLPLVEISGEVDAAHLGDLLAEHWNLLLSFFLSFVVIYVFWAAYGTAVRRAERAKIEPPVLGRLSVWWLLLVAFLPFPTAIVGRDATSVTVPVYIATMLLLSALTSTATQVVDNALGRKGPAWWAWAATAVFAVCALLSLVAPTAGLIALVLIGVVRLAETRFPQRRDEVAGP